MREWGGELVDPQLSQDSSSEDNRCSRSLYLFILITFLFLLLNVFSFVLNLKASRPHLITVLLIDKSKGQEKKEAVSFMSYLTQYNECVMASLFFPSQVKYLKMKCGI